MRASLLFIAVLCFVSCYQVERNCKDYQSGVFSSEILIDDIKYQSTFTRTASLQIETYNNKTDSSEVRWINDCEAVFRTINPKSMVDKKDIHLKILTTTDSTYTFEYSYVGETIKQKGLAKRLK